MFCRYCGHEQDDGSFCDKCGKPMGGFVQVTVDKQQPADHEEPVNYEDPVNYTETNHYVQPFDDTPEQPEIKRSKAPIIAAAVICAVAIGAGLLFVLVSGKNKVKTDDGFEKKPAVTTEDKNSQLAEEAHDGEYQADKDSSGEHELTTDGGESAAETTTTTAATTAATTTTAAPEPEKVEIIPATELFDMSTSEIKALVGDDYSVYENNENAAWGFAATYGITSEKYFPNTMIVFRAAETEEAVINCFENGESFDDINVFEGGLIGDGAKVGDSYHDMMTMVDSLGALNSNGVGTGLGTGYSFIDGHKVYLSFDHIEELYEISQKIGFEYVDAFNTDAKCVKANMTKIGVGDDAQMPAKVNDDGVAIRVAPYTDATVLLNVNKGDDIYLRGSNVIEVNGDRWYYVSAYYYNGVRKHGYIHAEYVDVD
ncbi:hypothetical protein [uncultured Ruminococcus sp.]|uniref:hypothetical protein n=1 Tax=uncultured Ruminococcus sp. TaxID=165186 RepID=UPI0025F2AD9B|nr:hypothetical protein [uncultured Ruminococcus sp.]